MSRTSVGVFSVLVLVFVILSSVSDALAERQCPPHSLPNGEVYLKNRARNARYKCARGFKIFGDRTATCLRGVWEYTDQMPVCARSGCPSLSSPDNGRAQAVRGFFGTVVTFDCYPGFTLTGSPATFCNGDRWNASAPDCDAHSTVRAEIETTLAVTTAAETTLAVTTNPETTNAETPNPETTNPETTNPETTKSETTKATTTKATTTKATTTKATTTKATTTKATTIKATTAKSTTSKATTTKVTTSKATTAKATTTKVTTSKATTAKATTAKATTTKATTAKATTAKATTTKATTAKATTAKATTTKATTTSVSKECDFEDAELCGWSHATDQHFQWTRHSGPTPSNGVMTGPSWDHTMGRAGAGHYMYTESSSPRLENDTARLVSPVFDASLSADACLVFYFHMFGQTIGTLNVYVKPEGRSQWPKIFTLSGQQGNTWARAVATMEPLDENFQIVFEGVRGSTYLGDMAIDDVRLANGTDCSESEANTTQAPIFDADASRSCRGRCFEPPPQHGDDATVEDQTDASATLALGVCHCNLACASNSACCEDFEDYCMKFNTWQVAHRVAESRGLSKLALYSALAAGTCVLLAVVAATSVLVVRRRRTARRRGNADDESEVRFLTADETLDFTLAQPKDDGL